jgi:hypothetical protein
VDSPSCGPLADARGSVGWPRFELHMRNPRLSRSNATHSHFLAHWGAVPVATRPDLGRTSSPRLAQNGKAVPGAIPPKAIEIGPPGSSSSLSWGRPIEVQGAYAVKIDASIGPYSPDRRGRKRLVNVMCSRS